ncbi:MAG: sugar ABC transporter permease [Anaerolineales bacterium]|nr:sugar ABC transporter permease [Anaerolineales bacterium]
MAQPTLAAPEGGAVEKTAVSLIRTLLSLGLAALAFVGLRWAVAFMKDTEAPERLLLAAYSRLGMDAAAAALQETGLSLLSSKLMITLVALLVGVLGVWLLFWVANDLIGQLPGAWRERVRPIIFVGPAVLLLGVFLIYPALNTVSTSLTEDVLALPDEVPEQFWASDTILADMIAGSDVTFEGYLLDLDLLEVARVRVDERPVYLFVRPRTVADEETGAERRVFVATAVGLQNYQFAFTSPEMRIAFRNNVLWLLVGTSSSVIIGLVFATLVDKIRREALAKTFIFLPLAISFVGASVIWKFVYAWQPAGRSQIGLLNALVTQFGFEPVPWIIETPLNTLALIVIMVWLQTGFAMVVLSAALKGIPGEIIEAARIDGATEVQSFFRVVIPMIRGSIITVSTTIFISILKVFDIVYVMTSGKFQTEVIANRMFVEMFTFRNFGRASALAVILLVVVMPIMVVNIRNLRRQGINR